jgi:hypothetical protein
MDTPKVPEKSYFKLYEKHLSMTKVSEIDVTISDETIDHIMTVCDGYSVSFDAVVGGMLQLYIDSQEDQTKVVKESMEE